MKTLAIAFTTAAIALAGATAPSVAAVKFNAAKSGGVVKKYSVAKRRHAVGRVNRFASVPRRSRSTFCVWQDSNGGWHAKKVNLLTVCINSFKVTCNNGQCSAG